MPEISLTTDIPSMMRIASLKCLSFTRSVMTTISAMPSWLRFCTIWAMLTSLLPRTPAIFARAPARFSTCKRRKNRLFVSSTSSTGSFLWLSLPILPQLQWIILRITSMTSPSTALAVGICPAPRPMNMASSQA